MEQSFYDLITSNQYTFEQIKKLFKCISETPTLVNNLHVLDVVHPGIEWSFKKNKSTGQIQILTDNGIRIYKKDGKFTIDFDEEKLNHARMLVDNMRVNVTGIRENETVVGIQKRVSGAVLLITDGIVPPSKTSINEIKMFPSLWKRFIIKIGKIPFFKNLDDFEKVAWLKNNSIEGDFDMAETGAQAKILNTGVNVFDGIDEEKMEKFLSTPTDLLEIRSSFPTKPGSKGLKGRSTLAFYLHFWKLESPPELSTDYVGMVYNLDVNKFYMSDKKSKEPCSKIQLENGASIAFVTTTKGNSINVQYFETLLNKFPNNNMLDVEKIKYATRTFTAAGYKSLLQKLIRMLPLKLEFVNQNNHIDHVNMEFALCVVFTLLLQHPGSFVPDIQRYVSGQESALKRLAISIFEDSYADNVVLLQKCCMMALFSQRCKQFKLSSTDYDDMLTLCLLACNTNYYEYDYNKYSTPIYSLNVKNEELQNCSAIIDMLKSFPSDLGLVRFIAKENFKNKPKKSFMVRPEIMVVEMCIDQHWDPSLYYFLSQETIQKYVLDEKSNSMSTPFKSLSRNIFHQVTGVNRRRGLSGKIDGLDKEFVQDVKRAQLFTLLARQTSVQDMISRKIVLSRKKTGKIFKFNTLLDISWIAGMAGPITIPAIKKMHTMVTLLPSDPTQMLVIKKPSRGMKDSFIPDDIYEEAIKLAKEKLEVGIPLNACDPPIPILNNKIFLNNKIVFKNCRLKFIYEKDNTVIKIIDHDKKEYTWEEISNQKIKIPIVEYVDETWYNFITMAGKGIVDGAFDELDILLNVYDVRAISRALSFISSFTMEFELPRISRDGGGVKQIVTPFDVQACQLLMKICILFPSALNRVPTFVSKFRVVNGPLLWKIKDHIINFLKNFENDTAQVSWKKWSNTRELKSFQIEATDEMVSRIKDGNKGNILFMTAGLGKTAIALNLCLKLAKLKLLPPYVIFAIPKTVISSLISECQYFKLNGKEMPINLLLPIETFKLHPNVGMCKDRNHLLPNHINIIQHDHLRKVADEIVSKAPESLIVIDEVHLTMNDTLRTGVTLQTVGLAKYYLAMTGTLVVDTNAYKLIQWFEQLVNFQVNEKNFWVAANSMIARKINTGVEIDRESILVKMNEKEEDKYNKLVPENLGGTNPYPDKSDINKAFELCYKVCDKKMCQLAKIKIGEGHRVMMVARNNKHQLLLKQMMIDLKIPSRDIFVLEKNTSIYLDEQSVKSGKMHAFKLAIVPIRPAEGYTLSYMDYFISSIYFTNEATREQLERRINRTSQTRPKVYYRYVHTGILTFVHDRYEKAGSISAVLNSISKELDISVKDV